MPEPTAEVIEALLAVTPEPDDSAPPTDVLAGAVAMLVAIAPLLAALRARPVDQPIDAAVVAPMVRLHRHTRRWIERAERAQAQSFTSLATLAGQHRRSA